MPGSARLPTPYPDALESLRDNEMRRAAGAAVEYRRNRLAVGIGVGYIALAIAAIMITIVLS